MMKKQRYASPLRLPTHFWGSSLSTFPTTSCQYGNTLTLKNMGDALDSIVEETMDEWEKYLATPKRLKPSTLAYAAVHEKECIPKGSVITFGHSRYEDHVKFKIGQRVVVNNRPRFGAYDPAINITGKHGVIKRVYSPQPFRGLTTPAHFFTVEFDEDIQGHDGVLDDLSPAGQFGHCWNLLGEFLEKEDMSHKAQKGGIMSALSTLAKRTFDADSKALVEVGVLDSSLRLANPELLLDMLIAINTKELAVEARARLKEVEAEAKKK